MSQVCLLVGPSYFETYGFKNKFKESDNNYTEDVKQLNDLEIHVSSKNIWLASRVLSVSGGSTVITNLRTVVNDGGLINSKVFVVRTDGSFRTSSKQWLPPCIPTIT